jgi:hypothetical protein
MLQKVDRNVAYVCNGYTRMLQTRVPNISSVFLKHVASVFILGVPVFDVAYILQ